MIKHRAEYKKLWKSLENFEGMITKEVYWAIEWPKGCSHWGDKRVLSFIERNGLEHYEFHGCALELKSRNRQPLKKPWRVSTNCSGLGQALSKYQCSCIEPHAHVRVGVYP